MGRLASIVAKELLNGQRVVVTRCEEINISGSLFRNKLKFEAFLRKRMNSNPKQGPIHYRAPSRIFWRVVRGMVPHKTARGTVAMDRLKVFDGVPHPYDKSKRQVVPQAIRNLRLKPGRSFCRLGDLASQVGWKANDLVGRLEEKRKVRSQTYYETKKTLTKLRTKAIANVAADLKDTNEQLEQLGFPLVA